MHYNVVLYIAIFASFIVAVKPIFQTFECIGCRFEPKIIRKYFKCHTVLPARIRLNGEKCIRKITKSTNRIEQWMNICSARDKFLEVFLCTDVSKGSPGGNAEKKEKLAMMKYIDCVYQIKIDDCMEDRSKEKLKKIVNNPEPAIVTDM